MAPSVRPIQYRVIGVGILLVLSTVAFTLPVAGAGTANHGETTTFQSSATPSPALVTQERADTALTSGETLWQGQHAGLEIPNETVDADAFELRRYDTANDRAGSFVREFSLDDADQYLLRTDSLDGHYVITPTGDRGSIVVFNENGVATGVDSDTQPFEVAEQTLRVGWEQDRITTGDTDVGLELESNRAAYNVNVSASGLEYEDLEAMFRSTSDHRATNDPRGDRTPFATGHSGHDAFADDDIIVLRGLSDGELRANFSAADPGDYSFVLEVTDTGVRSMTASNGDETTDDADDPAFFALTALEPASATLEPGTSLEVSVTVSNSGGETGTQDIDFELDGTVIGTEMVTLNGGEQTSVSVNTSVPDATGTYTYSASSDDDELEGTLTVEANETNGDEMDGETDSDTDTNTDADTDTDTDAAEDDQPGFGLFVGILALLGAVFGSLKWRSTSNRED